MLTVTQMAERIYAMAYEKDCADSAALDIEAVFRFLAGPVAGSFHVTARTVVHFAHTMTQPDAIKEIVEALMIAQGAHFARNGARA